MELSLEMEKCDITISQIGFELDINNSENYISCLGSVVQKHRICFNCLNFKHVAKFCRKPRACTVQGCNQKHHTLLHEGDEQVPHTGRVGATI